MFQLQVCSDLESWGFFSCSDVRLTFGLCCQYSWVQFWIVSNQAVSFQDRCILLKLFQQLLLPDVSHICLVLTCLSIWIWRFYGIQSVPLWLQDLQSTLSRCSCWWRVESWKNRFKFMTHFTESWFITFITPRFWVQQNWTEWAEPRNWLRHIRVYLTC